MMLQYFFESHLVEDTRYPLTLFDIGDYQIGLLPPEPIFFLQVIIVSNVALCSLSFCSVCLFLTYLNHHFVIVLQLLLIQMTIANALAVLCYYGIIKHGKDQSPVTPFLITFGIVLPLTSWTPFFIMDHLDIRSTVLRMGLVALPICVQLTCLQGKFLFVCSLSCDTYQATCSRKQHHTRS